MHSLQLCMFHVHACQLVGHQVGRMRLQQQRCCQPFPLPPARLPAGDRVSAGEGRAAEGGRGLAGHAPGGPGARAGALAVVWVIHPCMGMQDQVEGSCTLTGILLTPADHGTCGA